jgi:hypothetical protein
LPPAGAGQLKSVPGEVGESSPPQPLIATAAPQSIIVVQRIPRIRRTSR